MPSRALRISLCLLGGLFAYGLLVMVVSGGLDALLNWRLPDFSHLAWWQILIAPVAIGAVALAIEAALLPVQKYVIEPDRVTDPVWKRGLKAFFIIALLFGLMFGAVVGHDRGWF